MCHLYYELKVAHFDRTQTTSKSHYHLSKRIPRNLNRILNRYTSKVLILGPAERQIRLRRKLLVDPVLLDKSLPNMKS